MKSSRLEGLGGPVNVDRPNLASIDPALDSCCEREEVAVRKQAALRRTLQRFDVVEQRRKRHLVQTKAFDGCRCCYDPNSDGGEYRALTEYRLQQEELMHQNENVDHHEEDRFHHEDEKEEKTSEIDSDDEFDYLLDEDLPGQDEELKALEEMRRAELQFQILQREMSLQHGYGAHRQMHPNRVLKSAHSAICAVVHLFDPDSIASASLDWFLSRTLAPTCLGTKFLRADGRATLLLDTQFAARLLPRMQPERDIPALFVVRDGCVRQVCPRLQGLGGNAREIVPSVVEEWLERANGLEREPPTMEEICLIRPEEEALMDSLVVANDREQQEDMFDCGMPGCSKMFPHQHIGEANEQQDGLLVSEQEVVGM